LVLGYKKEPCGNSPEALAGWDKKKKGVQPVSAKRRGNGCFSFDLVLFCFIPAG
jgi:hypothetical protein